MKNNEVFQRVEKKYLLNIKQYCEFMSVVRKYIYEDEYGLHTICNIYYDTKKDELISRSIDKPIYKEKLRLRTYGVPDIKSTSFIEIKKKYNGIVYKRQDMFTANDNNILYINGGNISITAYGDRVPGEMNLGENTDGGKVKVEKPTGEMPNGEVPTGEAPTGEAPTGEVPQGEAPQGDTSTMNTDL